MATIALLPVRNEAWVLRHSLGCLSAFCDVILVNDQASEDDSRAICREFPKVQVLESPTALVCEQARWTLLDAARDFAGSNLLWCTDADELVAPALARAFLQRERDRLVPGTIVDCEYLHAWSDAAHYRLEGWPYAPYWKPVAVIDDRHADYARTRALPLHEERVPITPASPRHRATDVPVLHLQWLLPKRNQMRQAWYRCREWMEPGAQIAAINERYAVTLPARAAATVRIPASWTHGLTFPDFDAVDAVVTWQEREVLQWFDERGPQFFEPLEIWHLPVLRRAFQRVVGREPQSDRSHHPAWSERAGQAAWRMAHAARRRIAAVVR